MAEADSIPVEVAYALPQEQAIVAIEVPAGATIEQAIKASGLLERFPEIDLSTAKVGIFSRLATLATVLRARDRVEIYRPLIADPKEARKRRASKGR